MRYRLIVPVVILAASGCAALSHGMKGVSIMEMNQWDIVVGPDAMPSEQYAAEEFKAFFEQATGLSLPIVKEPGAAGKHVFIGPDTAMRASTMGFDTADFGPEDLRVVAGESGIAIAGGRPRGTLYGVYTFLEDSLGVRFLTPDHTWVPRVQPGSVLKPMDKSYHPPLEFRWSYFGEIGENHAFAARMRTNTVADEPRLGGKTPVQLINHSFSGYVSWLKYGKEHPEYFDEIDGKRPSDIKDDHYNPGVQLCTTNPDVLRIITEGVLADIAKDPTRRNISVSQNDNGRYCQCAACKAADDAAGSHMGSLLTMVNAVADAVAAKYPGVMVGTLAYWYSRKPPTGIIPRPNVQIQLCSIECCQIHPLDDPSCPLNTTFCDDIAGWGTLTRNVYVWTYITNFNNYLAPCPNLRAIASNIRFFIRNNAKGLFMQGPASGAEMGGLRNYVVSNLLWDPSRDEKKLADEFLSLHYGRAAEPIRRFIDLVHDTAWASGKHKQCHASSAQYGLGAELGAKGIEMFDEAMKLADSPEVRGRVEKASICCHALVVEPVITPAYFKAKSRRMGNDDGKPLALAPEPAQALRPEVAKFLALCRKYNVKMPAEWANLEEVVKALKEGYGMNAADEF